MPDIDLEAIRARADAATCEVTEEYAIKHLGFQWWSWIGTPVRGTPGYPHNMRVRQLLSPRQLAMDGWKKHLANPEKEARLADGTEPLDYTYCSSGCSVEWPPKRKVHARDVVKTDVPALCDEVERLRNVIREIDKTLRIPAAEYVPAIGDVFSIIDKAELTPESEAGRLPNRHPRSSRPKNAPP